VLERGSDSAVESKLGEATPGWLLHIGKTDNQNVGRPGLRSIGQQSICYHMDLSYFFRYPNNPLFVYHHFPYLIWEICHLRGYPIFRHTQNHMVDLLYHINLPYPQFLGFPQTEDPQ
jgi:hypothetical protein